ncbi:hypothetical protein BGI41_04740 [Methanobrevibacter sp. 87.7]|uniref:hypothetical protein n=1 Tax=Methanobrevibacter sp. 87.7 TaxID=387957 RepID=UPI000B50A87C|nr:hypothetical protein [Methanobrevibacter sp. 87.7]OWT32982.1 hypothetical protein BGI41_04740 [Methanobrevibacter sp. 87.7]
MELNELENVIKKHDYNKTIENENIIITLNEPHEMFLNNINLYNRIQKIILNKKENSYILELYNNQGHKKFSKDLTEVKSLRIYMNL